MGKELEGLEEGPKAKINIDLLRTTLKKQIGKHQAMIAYSNSLTVLTYAKLNHLK